jgi:AcrR family transcriptional regulator
VTGAPPPKGQATRARIVSGAAEVLREHGPTATLDDIRQRSGTSKSQLFHYFPGGKDELFLAVARFEAGRVIDDQQPYLSNLDSWDAWYCWRDAVVERYREQGRSCPLDSLVRRIGPTTPGADAVVSELLRTWQEDLASGVRALRDSGRLPPSHDVDATAAALLTALQGGVSIMLSTGSTEHLEAALDWMLSRMRTASAAEKERSCVPPA